MTSRNGVLFFLLLGCSSAKSSAASEPVYDQSFWQKWGDGQAEVASYRLRIPRYSEMREGVAVLITVSETMSESAGVKADPGRHSKSDEYLGLKQNLIEDFQTGVYDYNLMTSSFLDLSAKHGRRAGAVSKISFSSQEWCGHVYHQLKFKASTVESTQHSYFDGEADANSTMAWPDDAISADTLWMWARGLGGPHLEVGESLQRPILPRLKTLRLKHQELKVIQGRLKRLKNEANMRVMEASFGGRTLTFWVRADGVIQKWRGSDGTEAVLIAQKRMKYWEKNSAAAMSELKALGLSRGGVNQSAAASSSSQ